MGLVVCDLERLVPDVFQRHEQHASGNPELGKEKKTEKQNQGDGKLQREPVGLIVCRRNGHPKRDDGYELTDLPIETSLGAILEY